MQLLRHSYYLPQGCVATIGNFDGLHRGHVALLHQLVREAQRQHLPSVVILFEPQPREFLDPQKAPTRLTPFHEKIKRLRLLPIDYVICLRFNAFLAEMTAAQFVETILIKQLQVKQLIVGDDFQFGKCRQGNVEFLKHYHASFALETFSDFNEQDKRISSTAIRAALAQGNLEQAKNLLGRPYTVSGQVKKGAGRGRQWGFPTANISVHKKGLPLSGVFVVRVNSEDLHQYPGVANVGIRPTVDGSYAILEVLLLDFEGDLYNKCLEIEFLAKLRDEIKFDDIELLKEQIQKDIEAARAYFNL